MSRLLKKLFDWQRNFHFLSGGRPAGLHAEEHDLKVLTDNTSDIIVRCRPDGELVYVSPSSFRVLGWRQEEMVGKRPQDFVHPEDMPDLASTFARTRSPTEEDIRSTCRVRKSDGSWIWIGYVIRAIREAETSELGDIVIVARDITETKALEDQLNALAMTDGLTGLANRRAFDEGLDREWRRTLREGTQLSLLLIDVDHFKQFNDHYGHQVGDDCLRAVAAALKSTVRRPGDIIARYGGEEIAIILPDTATDGAVELAWAVCKAVQNLGMSHRANEDGKGIVTVSIGAATALARIGGTMGMPAGLLQAADMALYKAKRNGRNRVETTLLLAPDESHSGHGAAA